MTDPIRAGGPAPPTLQDFRDMALQGDTLRVVVDGDAFRVVAQGQMQAPGAAARQVAWVQAEGDATGLFLQSLSGAFGGGLSQAVARELGLEPASGQPLASRSVTLAIDMAASGRGALAGVDFVTQLEHSAQTRGASFLAAANALGLDPGALSPPQAAAVDGAMRSRFAAAAAQGQAVTSAQATEWLRGELAAFAAPRT